MTTFDTAILLTGGISLAALVGYASWLELRVATLKTELLESYAQFKVECASLNVAGDLAYGEMCEVFDTFIGSAEMFSLPFLAYLISVHKKDNSPYERLATTNADLQKAINRATECLAHTVAYHISHRTFSGGVLYLLLRVVPKAVVKAEASGPSSRS